MVGQITNFSACMPGVTGKLVKSFGKRNITEIGDTSTNPFALNPNKNHRRPSPVLCLDPDLFCRPIRSLTSLLNDDNDEDNDISLENFEVPTDSIDDLIKSEVRVIFIIINFFIFYFLLICFCAE